MIPLSSQCVLETSVSTGLGTGIIIIIIIIIVINFFNNTVLTKPNVQQCTKNKWGLVFVYTTHAMQAIAFEWRLGLRALLRTFVSVVM